MNREQSGPKTVKREVYEHLSKMHQAMARVLMTEGKLVISDD